MPKSKESKSTDNQNWSRNDANFASVYVPKDMQVACSKWMKDAYEDLETIIQNTLDESYRISLKYDYSNRCYACTYTQQDEKHHNAGIVLISRRSDPLEALLFNEYKIRVLFPNDPLPTQAEVDFWG